MRPENCARICEAGAARRIRAAAVCGEVAQPFAGTSGLSAEHNDEAVMLRSRGKHFTELNTKAGHVS